MNAGSSSSSSASSDCPNLFEKRGRRRIRDCAGAGPSSEEDVAPEDEDAAGDEDCADSGDVEGGFVLWVGVTFVGR